MSWEIHSSTDLRDRQFQRRQELLGLLGDLPGEIEPTARLLRVERFSTFDLEHLELAINGIEPVPAFLLLPHRRPQPAPALLYLHAHFDQYDIGKEELLVGRPGLAPYAPVLAEMGIVTLALDSWCFGGRNHHADGRQGEHDTFKRMLWFGQVLWGMMLFDEYQAISYLSGRPEVDPHRIGTFGMSMGATKSWWLAALDPRVAVCGNLCCLTDFQELLRTEHLSGHGIYYYVPRLLKHFQTADILDLIVPRPHLSLNGRHDPLTPAAGVERLAEHLRHLYGRYGHPGDARVELFDCGHEETPAMRQAVLEWLDRYLVNHEVA